MHAPPYGMSTQQVHALTVCGEKRQPEKPRERNTAENPRMQRKRKRRTKIKDVKICMQSRERRSERRDRNDEANKRQTGGESEGKDSNP